MGDKKDEEIDPRLGKTILKAVEEVLSKRNEFDKVVKGLPKNVPESLLESLNKALKAAEQQQKFMDEVKKIINESGKKK